MDSGVVASGGVAEGEGDASALGAVDQRDRGRLIATGQHRHEQDGYPGYARGSCQSRTRPDEGACLEGGGVLVLGGGPHYSLTLLIEATIWSNTSSTVMVGGVEPGPDSPGTPSLPSSTTWRSTSSPSRSNMRLDPVS